jgi:hypothetical protein
MSDVLLGVQSPLEEAKISVLEDVAEDVQSLPGEASLRTLPDDSYCVTLAKILLPFLSIESRKALRVTCRAWCETIDRIAPLSFPPSYRLPFEILQSIYLYLGPNDFNAARHTCRTWMRASLNKNMLATMLQRGGWWSSAEADMPKRNFATSEEYWLSCRLARECALSSGWTGNGLGSARGPKALVEVSNIDFADLANDHSSPNRQKSGGLVFATSICSQFGLVAKETMIYIYELRDTAPVPVTSIVCPRRVLSMSMDVSSGRHSIAALLEGRMGMVCDLNYGRTAGADDPEEAYAETKGNSYRAGGDRAPFDAINVQSGWDAASLNEVNDHRRDERNNVVPTWNLHIRGVLSRKAVDDETAYHGACTHTVPIEGGTSTFYRHLCSEDDPPRSVSICPQRRCVAFGNSAGIELHWIDAGTGQSLSRIFPLTAPSDYLYFLAPRPGFESAKKLRLISSAAHPDDRPAIRRQLFLDRPTSSSWWGTFGFDSYSRRGNPAPKCDHYRAVPLSDGHHILFTDPETSWLFMGCDAPLGSPTKLTRKVLLAPPPLLQKSTPRLYAAARDMSSGARIVVVFDDTIVLYSVPADLCLLSREEQSAQDWDVYNAPPFAEEGRNVDHWLDWCKDPVPSNRWGTHPIWPMQIQGTEIGSLKNVCEMTISTRPDITIWAFSLEAQAKVWQARGFANAVAKERRYVCSAGVVHDAYAVDEARDVVMTDAPSLSPPASPLFSERSDTKDSSIGFDGCASQILATNLRSPSLHETCESESYSSEMAEKRIPKALSVENDRWVECLDVSGCDAWYEGNGDVVVVPLNEETAWGWTWDWARQAKEREAKREVDATFWS